MITVSFLLILNLFQYISVVAFVLGISAYQDRLRQRSRELEEKKRKANVNCGAICGKGITCQ